MEYRILDAFKLRMNWTTTNSLTDSCSHMKCVSFPVTTHFTAVHQPPVYIISLTSVIVNSFYTQQTNTKTHQGQYSEKTAVITFRLLDVEEHDSRQQE